MAYRKFDDPPLTREESDSKVYEATMMDSLRKAFRAISNRVCGGTSGTGHVPTLASIGTGSTGGVKIGTTVSAVINGRLGTVVTQDNLELPAGTQSANTYCKYLVSASFATSGTVTAGNEASDSTSAHLPDLPAGHVALGYVEFTANSTTGFVRTNNVLTGVGTSVATAGTASFQDLLCMPYADEP